MKFILLLFLSISLSCFSQKAVVSIVNNNEVYLGLENAIHVVVSNYPEKDIRVITNNGSIKGINGEYSLKPDSQGICKLYIEIKENGENKIIDSAFLRVKKIDKAYATIGGQIQSGEISLGVFKVQQGVIMNLDYKYNLCATLKTTYYQVLISKHKTKQSQYLENKGAEFNDELKTEIAQLDHGDIIVFYNIKGELPNKEIVSAENEIVITLK